MFHLSVVPRRMKQPTGDGIVATDHKVINLPHNCHRSLKLVLIKDITFFTVLLMYLV